MLELDKIPDEERKDIAFQLVVAMRDTINIAKKKGHKSTYENAIRLFHDFSPKLYNGIVENLPQRNLSDDAKYFIAKAEAISNADDINLTPLEALEREIIENKELVKKGNSLSVEQKKIIRNKIASLESIRKSLKPRSLTEHRILARDSSRADRKDFGAQLVSTNDFFVDYELSDKKYLRIRLLHPERTEALTGADLIYEQHNEETGQIRILFLQYKIWDKGVLYFSQSKNLSTQLQKMEDCICSNVFCKAPEIEDGHREFRFPYCSAFLRPTDKVQNQNEKLVSSGIHIPVCSMNRFIKEGSDKLVRKNVRFQTLNHELFENLFNRGFIGSQWLDQEVVEEFYKQNKILEDNESVIFYAREISESKPDSEYADTTL